MKDDDVTLTCDPFRVCLLHNLLSNSDIINNIVDDMNTLDWSRKKMDLYEFHQTADLATLTWQRSIRGIYELLKTEVMSWVRPLYIYILAYRYLLMALLEDIEINLTFTINRV